jgi:Zn-dependent membrane protease YugP
MPFYDFGVLLFTLPAILLGMWAQYRVKATYAAASRVRANLSGAAAARHILNSAGLYDVGIEMVHGRLSDHYDPRSRVLRLSSEVYSQPSQAAVGIAAHEAGHAIQHAANYAPLTIRNAAVPAANFGSTAAIWLCLGGMLMDFAPLLLLGIIAFSAVVFFQLINLPVEFDASNRAKRLLVEHQIVPQNEMVHINKVLNAAALTYVAATLQSVLTLVYYIMRFMQQQRR